MREKLPGLPLPPGRYRRCQSKTASFRTKCHASLSRLAIAEVEDNDMICLTIVVPCFNEKDAIPETASRLFTLLRHLEAIGKITAGSTVCFVDDGSVDGTWALIRNLVDTGSPATGLKLSRNFGHQAALMAGLLSAHGDALVSIDADLQDDIETIEKMLDAHAAGAQIVYGVRSSREHDPFLKRVTAAAFYRLLARLGVQTIYNHADFRLMSRRAIEELRKFGESNLYLRGVIPQIGLRHAIVEYARAPRMAGKSNYSVSRMLALAWNGITSFSIAPLRWVTVTGFAVFSSAIVVSAWVLWVRIYTEEAVPGWASTVIPLFLLSGLQVLCVGVVGEYLGKVYVETKSRPRFIVEEIAEPATGQGTSSRSSGIPMGDAPNLARRNQIPGTARAAPNRL